MFERILPRGRIFEVTLLYKPHNPARLPDVGELMERYHGAEHELYQRICKKSGVPAALQAGTGTIGVRIPDHPATLQILHETGIPLTATSANVSGEPAETRLEGIQRQFGRDVTEGWIAVLDDNRAHEKPSTLIRWEGETLRVLRQGPISEAEIHRIIERAHPA